jgi:hypothetical protein
MFNDPEGEPSQFVGINSWQNTNLITNSLTSVQYQEITTTDNSPNTIYFYSTPGTLNNNPAQIACPLLVQGQNLWRSQPVGISDPLSWIYPEPDSVLDNEYCINISLNYPNQVINSQYNNPPYL